MQQPCIGCSSSARSITYKTADLKHRQPLTCQETFACRVRRQAPGCLAQPGRPVDRVAYKGGQGCRGWHEGLLVPGTPHVSLQDKSELMTRLFFRAQSLLLVHVAVLGLHPLVRMLLLLI